MARAIDGNKFNLELLRTAYRTDEGKPWVLPVVRQMEVQLAADESLNKVNRGGGTKTDVRNE